ncbi:hypothetical protein HMPREF9586_00319 [Cutibacterium acnes HL083PA2]|jgi:hypothetical protein|nr:hypothetical protein HMPREF9586_00319 [Cutibacterium acnes HL083PA2]
MLETRGIRWIREVIPCPRGGAFGLPRAVVSAVSWVHKAIFGKVGYACRREVRRSHRIVSPRWVGSSDSRGLNRKWADAHEHSMSSHQ